MAEGTPASQLVETPPAKPSRGELQTQYGVIVAEYRFQVQLNWDRAKHYLVFNSAVFGAAIALHKNTDGVLGDIGVAALLALAAANSLVGLYVVRIGHEFYQSVRETKTKLEKELGLGEFAIATTPGMRRDHDSAPAGTPVSGKGRWKTITSLTRALLWAIFVVAFVGAIAMVVVAGQDWNKSTTAEKKAPAIDERKAPTNSLTNP